MDNNCIIYRIDRDGKIVFLSDQWQSFADENKASDLTPNSVLGTYLSDHISDGKTRHLYEILIERSIKNNETLNFPFRCDSPEKRRFMSMEISPYRNNLIEFKSRIVREEARPVVMLLDGGIDRSNEFVTICSWCKKVRLDESKWVEVESAVIEMKLFSQKSLPQLSHGMCASCVDYTLKNLPPS